MDIKLIKQMANIVSDMNLGCLEVEEGELRIRIEGRPSCAAPASLETPAPAVKAEKTAAPEKDDAGVDFNEIHTVVSPMVGVFYSAASPESEPFVKIGGRVKKGETLCIVEAMKLMNEIAADRDGEIVDICAKNGDVVEYGQTLFKIF